jgi:hypothetical protein
VYPVIAVKAALTYRIFPLVSVMTTASAASSMAATRQARSIVSLSGGRHHLNEIKNS